MLGIGICTQQVVKETRSRLDLSQIWSFKNSMIFILWKMLTKYLITGFSHVFLISLGMTTTLPPLLGILLSFS